ncbi:hypothetical protein BJ968_004539 [Kineococcus aurantiacus]|uniref:Tox-REase-7 domain-containing protein n=1 Tax=Kineococcus aurantiacus TaxID=37633 RepID=A0A7Y9J394_9ACTN|nr:hypothetical protein [Kineococcus aurantiacus]
MTIGNQKRVLDGLTEFAVSEVKNVKHQDLTAQLLDNIKYAKDTGRRFDLYLRRGATVSGTLQKAISSGEVNLKWIPFT